MAVPWRALLFVCGCAVILAATAPIAANLRAGWRELTIGTIASLGAFALTLLFVRYLTLQAGRNLRSPDLR